MKKEFLIQDIKTLSEFCADAPELLTQVKETKRPLVITQYGNSAAVLVDVVEYEALLEKIEVLQETHLAETQIKEGKGIPHERATELMRV